MTQEQSCETCQMCEYTKRRLDRSIELHIDKDSEIEMLKKHNQELREPTLTSNQRLAVAFFSLMSVYALIYAAFYHAEIGFFRACIVATVLFTTIDYIISVYLPRKSE